MSEALARFLRNLSVDPSLLEAFEMSPETILADTDLSEDDRRFFQSGNREQWRQELSLAAEMPPGGVF